MIQQGYKCEVIAKGLEKHKAEEVRDKKREEYEAKGYKYKTRPQLS